jgi:hypothetical protein
LDLLDEILREVKDRLPPRPRVAEIYGYPYTDSLGDPAFRITVVLDEEFGKEGPKWAQLKPIQDAIFEAVDKRGVKDFPYVRFVTSRELAANPVAR